MREGAMDLEYTVRINDDDIAVTVQYISTDEWLAAADYQGTRHETSSDTANNAVEKLSRMLSS